MPPCCSRRSPKAPDANTDMGTHALRYGLLPHAGSWQQAGVAAHGWAFNAPLRLMQAPPQQQLAAASAAAAVSALSLAQAAPAAGAAAAGAVDFCHARPRLAFSPEQPMFQVRMAASPSSVRVARRARAGTDTHTVACPALSHAHLLLPRNWRPVHMHDCRW